MTTGPVFLSLFVISAVATVYFYWRSYEYVKANSIPLADETMSLAVRMAIRGIYIILVFIGMFTPIACCVLLSMIQFDTPIEFEMFAALFVKIQPLISSSLIYNLPSVKANRIMMMTTTSVRVMPVIFEHM